MKVKAASLERHRETGGAGAGALGDSLAKPGLARKFHDKRPAVLPGGRAAEIAARTLALSDAQSVEDLTALLTSAGSAEVEPVTAAGLRWSGGSPAASAPRGPARGPRGPRPRPRT